MRLGGRRAPLIASLRPPWIAVRPEHGPGSLARSLGSGVFARGKVVFMIAPWTPCAALRPPAASRCRDLPGLRPRNAEDGERPEAAQAGLR